MRKLWTMLAVLVLALGVLACGGGEPQTVEVEVTRIVPQTVEVTQIVPQTVEVTRIVKVVVTATRPPATSTPRPTRTHTPAPVGQSRRNPIPFGQPGLTYDGFQLTLIGVDWEAWSQVQAANPYNKPPREGYRMVMVRVHAENVAGKEPDSISTFPFSVVGSGNKSYGAWSEEGSCGVIDDELSAELFHGGEAEGNVCFQVPEDEHSFVLMYGVLSYTYFELGSPQ